MTETSATPFIRLTDISKSFGGIQALNHVSLTLYPGEIHALAGENGSGKSTLIKILSGVYQPDDGEIEINGQAFRRISPIDAVRMGIQIIYQDFSIFPNLTVRENIALSSEIMTRRKFVNRQRVARIADFAISQIGIDIDPDILVEKLPIADRQLVALARALHHDARLIVMDEPTTALTHKEIERLFSIIRTLQKRGVTILFVSHKINEVFTISENYTILRSGERVASGVVSELTNSQFVHFMTGREFRFQPVKRTIVEDTVLEVRNLTRQGAFSDISFKLNRGELVAITGLLGSGRTELAEALFGLAPADSGDIIVNGRKTVIRSVQNAMRHRLGYVPEDRLTEGLFHQRSIYDNALVSNLKRHCNRIGIINRRSANAEGEDWMRRLRVNTTRYENPVSTLSGGNQQKIILSRWLATDLRIFILNGPTVGVDIGAKFDLHSILRKLAEEESVSVIIISDDIPEVMACSDRILIMQGGRIRREYVTYMTTEEEISKALYTS